MTDPVAARVAELLAELGLDRDSDPELAETPERFAELLRDWFVPREAPTLRGIPVDESQRGLVVMEGLRFHALCAHHIVPFHGDVDIAYLPDEQIVGFGALPRLVDALARGPQLQERLVAAIADTLERDLAPRGALVRIRARQMCVELTGCRQQPTTTTLAGRGCYGGSSAAKYAQRIFST